jgi:4-amino-4-deoxy-L-arabinose transferase-like glycosyltransferase
MEAIRDTVGGVVDVDVAAEARGRLGLRAGSEAILIGVGFFVVVLLMGWWAGVFQYDTDEGLNLMKALLVARGYQLYNPIWSDQPPLYTLILAGIFKLVGPSLTAARLVSAAFGGLLVACLYDLLRKLVSVRAAIVGALFVVASAWFARLSYSAMIGLPSLALVMASFALMARWVLRPRWVTLIASALCMAAGVETKLFALVALPAAWVFLWLGHPKEDLRSRIVALLAWTVVVLGLCLAILAAFGATSHELVDTHRTASELRKHSLAPMALTLMRRDSDLVVLALLAVVVLVEDRRRNRDVPNAPRRRWIWAIVPLVWFACGAIVMQFHRPAWYHHSPLLAIPAAWAGAIAIDALFDVRRERARLAGFATLLLIGFLGWQSVKLVLAGRRMFVHSQQREAHRLTHALASRASETHWVFTDLPIYPLSVGLVEPPEVAVVSTKRRASGQLPDSLAVHVLDRYKPEQLLMGWRIRWGPSVTDDIAQHYRLVEEFSLGGPLPARLYVRDDLHPTTTARSKHVREKAKSPEQAES